jgi:hypothetical protein
MLKLATIVLLFSAIMGYQNKRMLLVYADNEDNIRLKQQKELLSAGFKGLNERDVEVKYYYATIDKAEFKKRKITSPFTVILVGKDGGDKLKSHNVVSLTKLYDTIDAMPMRQSEMKRHP